jgi:UDP-3-O-[3-hydroxymyristoyl] glucosamine N-acyltransferase
VALQLGEIVAALGGELHGDASLRIEGLAPLEARSRPTSLSSATPLPAAADASRAGCVIVAPPCATRARRGARASSPKTRITTSRGLTQLWKQRHAKPPTHRVHPTAVIDPEAHVDATAMIGPNCSVARGARIGAHTVLKANVSVGEDCLIGERCTVQPGAVIGSDGFGFAPHDGQWEKIEAAGGCAHRRRRRDRRRHLHRPRRAGRHGDRGTVVKLDNLIQIAHNVRVGAHTAIAACHRHRRQRHHRRHCMIGGAAMILGHLTIVDGTFVSAGTFVAAPSSSRACTPASSPWTTMRLGKERRDAQAAAHAARAHQGPGKET